MFSNIAYMSVAASSTLPPALAGCHHLLHHQMLGPDMRIALADAFEFFIQNYVSLALVCTNRHFVCTKQKYFLCSSEKE